MSDKQALIFVKDTFNLITSIGAQQLPSRAPGLLDASDLSVGHVQTMALIEERIVRRLADSLLVIHEKAAGDTKKQAGWTKLLLNKIGLMSYANGKAGWHITEEWVDRLGLIKKGEEIGPDDLSSMDVAIKIGTSESNIRKRTETMRDTVYNQAIKEGKSAEEAQESTRGHLCLSRFAGEIIDRIFYTPLGVEKIGQLKWMIKSAKLKEEPIKDNLSLEAIIRDAARYNKPRTPQGNAR